eukprot:s1448_g19.t1
MPWCASICLRQNSLGAQAPLQSHEKPQHQCICPQCLPPMDDLLCNGKWSKEVLSAGDAGGRVLETGDRVTLHYTCRLGDSHGALLDDSRGRNEPFSFTLGEGEVIPAWEQALCSMKCGEFAALTVHPEMAFGNAPVAGGANLVESKRILYFELELLDTVPAAEAEVCREDLSAEERLVQATKAKEEGNTYFKAGTLEEAARSYLLALELLGFEADADARAEDGVWSDAIRSESRKTLALACQLNLSQCMLKLEDHQSARYHAEAALLLHPKNSKALYRRGLAGLGCGLLQQAKEDLREAAKLEPRNADIRRHLQECQQRMTEEKSSTKDAYGGFLVRSQDS